MTKTLTEQWREGTLPAGFYYLEMNDGLVIIDHTIYVVGEKIYRWELSSVDYVKEVISAVPRYEQFIGLIDDSKELDKAYDKINLLEKRLEIATKALKEYADSSNWYETDDFGVSAVDQFGCDDYGYNIAQQALKEMEGVK